MSLNPKPFLAFFLLLVVLSDHAFAGREIPQENPKTTTDDQMKQPEFFFHHDRGFLVPGIGRFIYPKKGQGYNPFTYNPVTGTNGGTGIGLGDGSGGAPRNYIPGGDDTFVPNPGVEVPIPGTGGGLPSPARH